MLAASDVSRSDACQATTTAHVTVTTHATRASSPRFGLTSSNSSESSKDAAKESGRGSKDSARTSDARGSALATPRAPSAAPQRLHSEAVVKLTSPQPAHFGLLA